MPFLLFFLGILLIVVAIRNTQLSFVQVVGKEFSGQGNFFYWIVALVAVGAVGYIPKAKPVSDGLLVIILLALILASGNPNAAGGGVFQQLEAALGTTAKPSAASLEASNAGSVASNAINAAVNSLA